MSILAAVFLGLVQGVAEFLPISSSGHLAVLQNVFNLQTAEDGHMFFDVLLHLGTVLAIINAYWKDVCAIVSDSLALLRDNRQRLPTDRYAYPGARMLLMLFFGTLPLVIVLPFQDRLEELYYSTGFIGAAFLITGCILWVSDRMTLGKKNGRSMRISDALIIGLCQAIATIPGLSRSGCTITAGIATGHTRSYAMKYSLLMSVPAVLGANLLSLIKALKNGVDWSYLPAYLIGTAVALVSGYFTILLLQRILRKDSFGKFSYYLWGVGILSLIASLF